MFLSQTTFRGGFRGHGGAARRLHPHRAGSRLYVAAAHAALRASMPSGAPIPLNLAATQQLQQSLRPVALQLHLLTTSGISGNQGSQLRARRFPLAQHRPLSPPDTHQHARFSPATPCWWPHPSTPPPTFTPHPPRLLGQLDRTHRMHATRPFPALHPRQWQPSQPPGRLLLPCLAGIPPRCASPPPPRHWRHRFMSLLRVPSHRAR